MPREIHRRTPRKPHHLNGVPSVQPRNKCNAGEGIATEQDCAQGLRAKKAAAIAAGLDWLVRYTTTVNDLLSLPGLSDRQARRRLTDVRRRVRSDPALAAHFIRNAPPRPGRPRGRIKIAIADAVLFVAVDMMKCSPKQALESIGRNTLSESGDYAWLARRRKAWRHALTVIPQQALTIMEELAEVLPRSLDGTALDGAGLLRVVSDVIPSLFR